MKKISEEYSPVRKAQTVYGSISGNYAFRGEKTIWYESTLERDFLIKQEFNSSVIDVISQPIVIPYITELGNKSTYTPDFLVQFSGANHDGFEKPPKLLLIEIKPNKKLFEDWEKLRLKFRAAHAFAVGNGWKFKIINESRLYDKYWENINFLKKFRRSHVDENDQKILIDTLNDFGKSTVNQLAASIFKDKTNVLKGVHQIWALAAKRKIMCDLHHPLTAETVIWVNDDTFVRSF